MVNQRFLLHEITQKYEKGITQVLCPIEVSNSVCKIEHV
jgi:hypothetical protein